MRLASLVAAIAIGWIGCDRPPAAPIRIEPGRLGVLFVGNSLTFHNDLPGTVEALSVAAGPPLLDAHDVAVPAATLEDLWNGGRAAAAIRAARWKFVVLQEQSERPLRNPAAMARYASRLHEAVRAAGATTVLYATWPNRSAPADNQRIDAAYLRTGERLGAPVAQVGLAWQLALQADERLPLYAPDGVHPTPAGTYLAACVLYSTLTGRSPVGLSARSVRATTDGSHHRRVTIEPLLARRLQQIADSVVRGPGRTE